MKCHKEFFKRPQSFGTNKDHPNWFMEKGHETGFMNQS
jgi:hypothetical protein